MAYPLSSPGIDVEVTDEAFYASSGTGTVPLFFIGTHQSKTQPNSTTIAAGTLPENANLLYSITSQRDLIQTFGTPYFYSPEGTPVDGYELNEYGLHAAYQYLGLATSALVIRAGVDYGQLAPLPVAPVGPPLNGTYWLDTKTSTWGIQQYNGTSWVNQLPLVIEQDNQLTYTMIGTGNNQVADPATPLVSSGGNLVINTSHVVEIPSGTPLMSIGITPGVVDLINEVTGATSAYIIGIDGIACLMLVDALNEGQLDLSGSDNSVLVDLGFSDGNDNQEAVLAPTPTLGSAGMFAVNTIYSSNNIYHKLASFYMHNNTPVASMPVWCLLNSQQWSSSTVASPNGTPHVATFGPHYTLPGTLTNVTPRAGDVWVVTTPFNNGANIVINLYNASTGVWSNVAAPIYQNNTEAVSKLGTLSINSSIYIQCPAMSNDPNVVAEFTPMILSGFANDGTSQWSILNYEAQGTFPTTDPADGTLWFNNQFQADIMVSNGQAWKGYRNVYPQTDPNGPILDASPPTLQSDYSALVDNDIWINTSLAVLEDYPRIYRYVSATKTWNLINNKDNTTPSGIIFADARWNVDGSIDGNQTTSALATSDFCDPDAPDALLYPTGMLLWNTRFSTMNVKQWQSTQFSGLYDGVDYTAPNTHYTVGVTSFPVGGQSGDPAVSYAGRWVTVSGNNGNVPYMGRKAQRRMIVQSLKAATNNDSILSETFYFNLIASPGYPELMSDMVSLNDAKQQVAFVVGDVPPRLEPTGTSITNWTTNAKNASESGEDGLTTASKFLGIWYPWGLSTNVDGTNVVVPSSTIALRTIAYSDSVSYPWYTPAGYTRGLVNNASSVGYINATTGLYTVVALNLGQRNVLYQQNLNAIAYMPNRGLVIMGDKTLDPISDAENRINVARLINYLRYNLNIIAQPYLFEPNIQHTQNSAKTVMDRFLANLISLNALYDFIVVCDSTNNTPQRVDNNELWIDIAIQPTKTIDFIYIPLRIESTGTDLAAIYSGNSGRATTT